MIREGSIQIPFEYAAGQSASRFLTSLRDEKLILGSRCEHCREVACPPRSFCPSCAQSELTFVELKPSGHLVSWTEIPGRGVYGLVLLDGADTSMFHRLLFSPSSPGGGARVRAKFASDRTGSILDIEGFELAEEGES